MNRQYVGARYVPKFYNGSHGTQWDEGVAYEPLTVVSWLNCSYTSKKPVPQGIGAPNLNPNYWALTGNYDANIGSLTERVDTIENVTIPALDSRVTSDEIQIGQNTSDIVTLNNSVTAIDSRLTTAEGNITSIDGRVTTVEGGLSTAQNDITSLDGRVTTVEGGLSTAQGDITSLGGRVTTVEGGLSTAQNDITSLSGRVTTVEGGLSTAQGDITSLGNRLGTAEGDITSLDTRVDSLETTVSNHTTAISANTDAITANTTSITNLNTRTTALETTVASFISGDIRRYGGKADGTTDNAQAIRNCLAENGYCLMPNYNGQSYVVNSTIDLTAGQTIEGTEGTKIIGSASTLFNIKGLNVAVRNLNIAITGVIAFHLNNAVADVSYINIDNVYTTSADRFIDDDASGSHLITNLYINRSAAMYNRKEGVLLRKAYAFIFMNDFTVTFIQTTPNYPAFHIIGCQGAQLTRCEAEGGFVDGTHTQNAGFFFENSVAIWLDRCMADTLDNAGFYFSACSYIYLDNCVASLCGSHGFAFVGVGANNNQMRGCYIVGRKTANPELVGAHGIYMLAGYSKVMECTISDFTGYGYTSDGAMNNVSDCSFANCLASVYVTGGSGIIHDNMVSIEGDTMSVTGATKYNNYINGVLVA